MAENAPQKSPMERQQDRMRFSLAIIGRRALDLAQEQCFQDWDTFEAFLRELLGPVKQQAPRLAAPADPGSADGDQSAATDGAGAGPRPPFAKAALESMEANGVDEELLLTFLKGHGSGPGGEVMETDVERYLHA